MTLLERLQERRQARLEVRKAIDEKNERGFEKDIKLEKGDLFAILIAGFVNFVLPIMLIIGIICGLAYWFFTRFR